MCEYNQGIVYTHYITNKLFAISSVVLFLFVFVNICPDYYTI